MIFLLPGWDMLLSCKVVQNLQFPIPWNTFGTAKATDRVIAGLEGRALSDNASKKLIAYHEADRGR